MKRKFALIFLSFVVLASACNNDKCISGKGEIVSEQRNVEDFTKIELQGEFKVVLTQDSFSTMRVIAPENIVQQVKSRVSGNILSIKMDKQICDSTVVELVLSSKNWESIIATGSSDISGGNLINANNLDINLSGVSKINLNLIVSRLKTQASGSSEISLSGQCRQHIIDLSGSNKIQAFGFVVSDYKIESSGKSKLDINVLSNLEVKTSGVSEISYKGSPKNISKNESGSLTLTATP